MTLNTAIENLHLLDSEVNERELNIFKGYLLALNIQPKDIEREESTWIDNSTGIMWANPKELSSRTYDSAKQYVMSANSTKYLGYTGWMLPTKTMLEERSETFKSRANEQEGIVIGVDTPNVSKYIRLVRLHKKDKS
jgi:hypothetical protein